MGVVRQSRTLDRALERLDAVGGDIEGLTERLAESRGKHEIEEVVHVLGEDDAEGLGQHTNALVDRILGWRVLFPEERIEERQRWNADR